MRITTWNVNGLRAALKKDMARYVLELSPDVLLLQEVRSTPEQLPSEWRAPKGWHVHWHPAEKLGWSGVATWSKLPAERVSIGLDGTDSEGRVLDVRVSGVRLVNVYLPSGSAGPERQVAKEAWMDRFLPWAADLARRDEPVILCGDLNIAHLDFDVAHPSRAKKLSGFLPHEREWFGRLLASGWTDLVRTHAGPVQGPYSWWSNFGRARAEDRGWRIDHALANAVAARRLRAATIWRDAGLAVSDHAPVTIDLVD